MNNLEKKNHILNKNFNLCCYPTSGNNTVDSNAIITQFLLSSSEMPGEFCFSWNQYICSVNCTSHCQVLHLRHQELVAVDGQSQWIQAVLGLQRYIQGWFPVVSPSSQLWGVLPLVQHDWRVTCIANSLHSLGDPSKFTLKSIGRINSVLSFNIPLQCKWSLSCPKLNFTTFSAIYLFWLGLSASINFLTVVFEASILLLRRFFCS